MRLLRRLSLLSALVCTTALGASTGAPIVLARTPLSALPSSLSVGPAGPFNRVAFDLENFSLEQSGTSIECVYGNELRYRCDAASDPTEPGSVRRRITVSIPDLGRARRVIVRFTTPRGRVDVPVELANAPQVVHEIEAIPLTHGGQTTIGGRGERAPIMQMVSERATTMPAMAASTLGAAAACDQVNAEWVGASATDPVFSSEFGTLNGSIVVSKPVIAGSRVRPDNLPQWLVSYPLSANRLQFIAHYEVMYRVGPCPHRVIRN